MSTRILQIIPTLVRGGAEKQLVMLATGLPRNDYDVHVCVLTLDGPFHETLQSHDIPVHEVGKTWKVDPFAYARLRKHIRDVQPDIVQTWLFAANSYGRFAALRCGVKRLIAGERCVDRWKLPHQFALDRYLARRSSAIVVPSSCVRDYYVEHGLPVRKFHVIPNGITAQNGPVVSERAQVLEELKLPSDAKLIGAVGRLWPQKRVKDAIWAAGLISEVRDDAHLLIIGDGPQRWRLERFCSQIHENDQIHFLGHRDDVPQLMPHFDCLWLTSGYEGLPNCIMEAMALSIPVVATDIPGNRDLVVSGQSGYLVEVGNRAAFARFTMKLLDDASLRKKMGANGRQRIIDHFSTAEMIRRYDELYQSVL